MPEENLVAVGHEKTPDGLELSIRGFADRRLRAINPTSQRRVSTWISLSLAGCSSAEPTSVSANIFGLTTRFKPLYGLFNSMAYQLCIKQRFVLLLLTVGYIDGSIK